MSATVEIEDIAAAIGRMFGVEAVAEHMTDKHDLAWCFQCSAWVKFSERRTSPEHNEWTADCSRCGHEVDESCEVPESAIEPALRLLASEVR